VNLVGDDLMARSGQDLGDIREGIVKILHGFPATGANAQIQVEKLNLQGLILGFPVHFRPGLRRTGLAHGKPPFCLELFSVLLPA
jgi:hypothetical protein